MRALEKQQQLLRNQAPALVDLSLAAADQIEQERPEPALLEPLDSLAAGYEPLLEQSHLAFDNGALALDLAKPSFGTKPFLQSRFRFTEGRHEPFRRRPTIHVPGYIESMTPQ